jgi:hypothetical protein
MHTKGDRERWPHISQFSNWFYDGNLSMKSINSSYITLISKVENPTTPEDFRPITHLNSALKIITKLLANGL